MSDPTVLYDSLRHFADSWGLLFMFAVFLIVVVRVFLPGAASRARDAAQIPLEDDDRPNVKGIQK